MTTGELRPEGGESEPQWHLRFRQREGQWGASRPSMFEGKQGAQPMRPEWRGQESKWQEMMSEGQQGGTWSGGVLPSIGRTLDVLMQTIGSQWRVLGGRITWPHHVLSRSCWLLFKKRKWVRRLFQDCSRSRVFCFACFMFVLQGWAGGGGENQQLAFGCIKFKMPNRHPAWAVTSHLDIRSLWFWGEVWPGVLTMGVVNIKTVFKWDQ